MSGNHWLDWVILTVSIFNTMLLTWLGVTVWLHAERRSRGVLAGVVGLLVGALFFISHSALVSRPLFPFTAATDFWWHAGWGPVIVAPLAWYMIMLWYTGYWEARESALHRRHRVWLVAAVVLAVIMLLLLLAGNPLPDLEKSAAARMDEYAGGTGLNVPLLIFGYPLYIMLCIGLALDALLRPGPSARFMGDQARGRARPWLAAASLALMVVSFLVGFVLFWLFQQFILRQSLTVPVELVTRLAWYDLLIAALIGLAVLLLGQAIVSYEIFTGHSLPRRGLLRQWQNTIILAVDVSAVVAAILIFDLPAIYGLLLTVLMLTVFYALFGWRTFTEREQLTGKLRPFVTSQRLYDQLLDDQPGPAANAASPAFAALCGEVLEARQACLLPLGPLAPLAGPPLFYPAGDGRPLPDVNAISARFDSPQTLGAALDPAENRGFAWAVPLWSERGQIGLLLLGEKQDGGYYSQEEMEIARASGERLVDANASAEIARRLILLQRQRLAESQVLDRQTRRVLHDDVLPLLHSALLSLNSGEGRAATPAATEALTQAHREISNLLRDIPPASSPEVARLGLLGALRQALSGEFPGAFDSVDWQVSDPAKAAADALRPLPAQVMFYAAREAVRNAARYGRARPGAPLKLTLRLAWQDGLLLQIEDSGGSLETGAVEPSGSGHGLALHSTMMAVAGGTLTLESQPGAFTRVSLHLPPGAC